MITLNNNLNNIVRIRQFYTKVFVSIAIWRLIQGLLLINYKLEIFSLINFISVFGFLLFVFLLKVNKARLCYYLVHLEMTFYCIFSILLVGWDYNTQYFFIFLIVPLPYFSFRKTPPTEMITLGGLLLYSLLYFYLRDPGFVDPDFSRSVLINTIAYINLIFIIVLTYLFTRVSNHTNRKNNKALIESNENLQKMINHDAVTGLLTRPPFIHKLYAAKRKLLQENKPYVLIFGDIDNFKVLNDFYGHEFGDEILKRVGEIIMGEIRETDSAARWGGEEFLVMLENININDAILKAEKIRRKIEQTSLFHNESEIKITMTLGLAEGSTSPDIYSEINRADKLMYEGKVLGKNKLSF